MSQFNAAAQKQAIIEHLLAGNQPQTDQEIAAHQELLAHGQHLLAQGHKPVKHPKHHHQHPAHLPPKGY